mmetsp:Transcript_1771/g.4994  ORF Transcript_1771/g.4994 Transcript_1771/m.4994 type:complete len:98 (-) Transcript_1771:599-892(-)
MWSLLYPPPPPSPRPLHQPTVVDTVGASPRHVEAARGDDTLSPCLERGGHCSSRVAAAEYATESETASETEDLSTPDTQRRSQTLPIAPTSHGVAGG